MADKVFFTGAPGSKWSGCANVLQSIISLNFNITDRSPEREYRPAIKTLIGRTVSHTGVYFGPGHGHGEDFHNIHLLDPIEVEKIIEREWKDISYGKLLVKSHFFSHHLDYIAETWENSPIIMILRPNIECEKVWHNAGGWDISYPNYRPYYKNNDTMSRMIVEHNEKIIDFCNRRNVEFELLTPDYLKKTFAWTLNSIENSIEKDWIDIQLSHIRYHNDVRVGIWNLDKLVQKEIN